jgi:hypothetical protein
MLFGERKQGIVKRLLAETPADGCLLVFNLTPTERANWRSQAKGFRVLITDPHVACELQRKGGDKGLRDLYITRR